jgi:hypothetical protein
VRQLILGIGKDPAQEQKALHSGETYEMFQHLVLRYDMQELSIIFQNFTNDRDFKALLAWGLSVLDKEITVIESEMNRLGLPLPKRPPRSINTPANTEIFRDETMFRTLNMFIQISLYQLQRTGIIMLDPKLRDLFLQFQVGQTEMYTRFITYGRIKGWLPTPPRYRG